VSPTQRIVRSAATAAPRSAPASGHVSLRPSQQRFLNSMIAELLLRDPDGSRLDRVDDPDALARETAGRVVDTATSWEAHLGAFYDVEGVRTLLSRNGRQISKQAVSKRRGLLALTTGSGRVVYPRFQFSDGAPLPGLDAVLAALPEPLVSRWTVASWLVSPQPALDDERPIDVLREGAVAPVVTAACAWADALAA
jgi:Protein of unknown function (DUF2384)